MGVTDEGRMGSGQEEMGEILHRNKAGNGEIDITVLQRNPRDWTSDHNAALISVVNFLYFTGTEIKFY